MGEQVPLTKRQPKKPPAEGSRNKHTPLFSSFPPSFAGLPRVGGAGPSSPRGREVECHLEEQMEIDQHAHHLPPALFICS